MQKIGIAMLLVALATPYSLAVQAEVKTTRMHDRTKTETLVNRLRSHKHKFKKLLTMRDQVNRWEIKLIQKDQVLSVVLKEYNADQVKLTSGLMDQEEFNKRWVNNKRLANKRNEIKKFQTEIKKYNKYRESYNALATELAKFLYKRNPKDLKNLIRDMDNLLVNLEQAISVKDYTKAAVIASNSSVASEFGF